MLIVSLLFFCFCLLTGTASARTLFYTPDHHLEHKDKKRITEILRKENFKIIEPFFYVSNRPTIQQALADEIRHGGLISPENHMIYCPPGKDYFTQDSLGVGTIYISAENLPKNGRATARWFSEAAHYRTDQDPSPKPANVNIISAEHRNFLRVKCPRTNNHIIVSNTTSPYKKQVPQNIIDNVHNLRYSLRPDIKWDIDKFTLPSTRKSEYLKTEKRVSGLDNANSKYLTPPEDVRGIAQNVARKSGVFIKFLLAIAKVGSDFNQDFAQRKHFGIAGLPISFIEKNNIEKTDIFKIDKSLMIAAKYIQKLHIRFSGNIDNILLYYYAGEGNIDDDARYFMQSVKQYIDPNQPILLN